MNDNRFSPTAETAIRLAQEAAGELGHAYVGTSHKTDNKGGEKSPPFLPNELFRL